ncbi:MAG: hypothetical protein H8D49_04960 [Dehalococcoidia bacterium]|nr:hypothetical protein [Dehalococcoidia bacterium]
MVDTVHITENILGRGRRVMAQIVAAANMGTMLSEDGTIPVTADAVVTDTTGVWNSKGALFLAKK